MSGKSISTKGYLGRACIEPAVVEDCAIKNKMHRADRWINKQRNKVMTITINLIEKASDSLVTIKATPDETIFKFISAQRMTDRFVSRDFEINTVDYDFGVGIVKPQKGDRIVEETCDKIYTFEAMSINAEPVYVWAGAYREAYIIHTKLVKEEDVV